MLSLSTLLTNCWFFAVALLSFSSAHAQAGSNTTPSEPPPPVEIIDRRWGEILIDWKDTEVTADLGGWVNNIRWRGYGSVRFDWRPGVYPAATSGEPDHPYQGGLRFINLPDRRYRIWVNGSLVGTEHQSRTLLADGLAIDGLPAPVGGPDRANLSVEVLIRSR